MSAPGMRPTEMIARELELFRGRYEDDVRWLIRIIF